MSGMDQQDTVRVPSFPIRARAAKRRPPPGVKETPEQVREATRAILAQHTPDPPPDPLTGAVIE